MEDPSEEYWEIEDYSQPYESDGKLGWIWRKGLSIGKKIVVTGVVITSAPLVLPPLVALSAIGIAFSVPAGFVFVTYACTDKLLNTLLPMPPSPPPWPEDGTMYIEEEGYRVYEDDVDKGYEEDDDIEAEEKDFEEDTRKDVEMRIELVEEGNDKRNYGPMPVSNNEVNRRMKVNEIVEEGYEEDVGENEEDEKQLLNSNEISKISEGIREAEDEISLMKREEDKMPTDSLQAVVVAAEVGGRNEDNVDQVLENLSFVGAQNVEEENGHTENSTDIKEEEMRRETTGLIEELRDEGKEEIPIKDTQNKGNSNLFVIPEEVKPAVDDRGVINGLRNDEISNNVGSVGTGEIDQKVSQGKPEEDESVIKQAEPKPVIEERLVVHVKSSGDGTTTDVCQGSDSNGKTGTLVLSDADAREMADESGFHLFDHGTGKEPSSKNAIDVNVYYQEVPIESTVPIYKGADTALEQDITAGPNKASTNEEKIWEQIHAMRTIVGYRDAPHSSCVEELKALYIFTGVEPPASSKDPADPLDIDERLHFLMSIIGVK